jgi:hypothetical protein
VSLVETERREEMERNEARRKARKGDDEDGDPLISEEDILAAETLEDADVDDDSVGRDEDDEEEGPDLLLREAARIAADMAGFSHDMQRLQHAFSQLQTNSSSDTRN